MSLKEHSHKIIEYFFNNKPIIPILFLSIGFGLTFIIFGSTIIENFFNVMFITGLLIISVITFLIYKQYERPFEDLIFPLFASITLIFYTAILFIYALRYNSLYISSIEPKLNHLSFPIAFFALGVTLFYFVIGQFSSERKLDRIVDELKDIKTILKPDPSSAENESAPPISEKQYSDITEEDKLIFEHLFRRHQNLLVFGDSIDTKFSQMIALNGLIMSFVLIKSTEAKNIYVFILGISLILLAIGIGIYGYKTREWLTGVKRKFFEDYDSFVPGTGIKKLKKQLLIDIDHNTALQNQKAKIFNIMLCIDIVGFVTIVFGYYV